MKIESYLINKESRIKEAMSRLGSLSPKILFVVNNNVLYGSLTDGDVRRYLLSGGKINDQVHKACNLKCKYSTNQTSAIKKYNSKNYLAIPIVNKNKEILDIYIGKQTNNHVNNVPIVINAGGKGTRLKSLTKLSPKPLVLINDKTIIELIMDEFKKYEWDKFNIIVNYKKEQIKNYFKLKKEYNIKFYDENSPLGTAGGLKFLEGKIHNAFFFSNCDILLKCNYLDIYNYHRKNKNVITVVCAKKKLTIPYGVVDIRKDNTIKLIKEKPNLNIKTITGLYVIEPCILKDIGVNENIDFPNIIEREIKNGKKVSIYEINEEDWYDMGQLEGLDYMKRKMF